uniref:transposase n=1 Tax=Alkaliflexus imshenetskii TaxID=286730 RepID=UPI000A03992B|nr:transposase [Alkaliflexus imshenetskii]
MWELRRRSAMDGFKVCIEAAHQKKWVVYCEPSMAGAEHVIRYLGQYTHRIAISNQRILNVDSTNVTFVAKDYRDRAQIKPVSLNGEEFLRRFSFACYARWLRAYPSVRYLSSHHKTPSGFAICAR